MAESPDNPTSGGPVSGPASADNPTSTAPVSGPETQGTQAPAVTQPPSSPPQQYVPIDVHERTVQQLGGIRSELDRWRNEATQREQQLVQAQQDFQRRLLQAAGYQDPQQPQQLRFTDAVQAYLSNNDQAALQWEQNLDQRFNQLFDQRFNQFGESIVKAGGYQGLLSEHRDLLGQDLSGNTSSPHYAKLLEEYQLIANDPTAKYRFPQDQSSMIAVNQPGVPGQKQPVDARILNEAAWRVRAKYVSPQEAARQEALRNDLPTADGSSRGAPPPPPADAPLLYRTEEALLSGEAGSALMAQGRGKTTAELAAWMWKNLPEGEKQKRLAMKASGSWSGVKR